MEQNRLDGGGSSSSSSSFIPSCLKIGNAPSEGTPTKTETMKYIKIILSQRKKAAEEKEEYVAKFTELRNKMVRQHQNELEELRKVHKTKLESFAATTKAAKAASSSSETKALPITHPGTHPVTPPLNHRRQIEPELVDHNLLVANSMPLLNGRGWCSINNNDDINANDKTLLKPRPLKKRKAERRNIVSDSPLKKRKVERRSIVSDSRPPLKALIPKTNFGAAVVKIPNDNNIDKENVDSIEDSSSFLVPSNQGTYDDIISHDNNIGEDDYLNKDSRTIVDPSDKYHTKWEEKFQLLVEYKKKHKTIKVSRSHNPKLGNWINNQRTSYKREKLSEYHVQRLNSIGFVWQVQICVPWMTMYNRLLSYRDRNDGSTNVPYAFVEYGRLRSWVQAQKSAHRQGKLLNERVILLESIGFQWQQLEDKNSWMNLYQRLIAYKMKHEDTRVPRRYNADPQLGLWVQTQRQCCKEKNRTDLLNDIGFEWKIVPVNDWGAMYDRLLTYKKEHGTTCVPKSKHNKEDSQLATWVSTQRQYCKEKDRVDLLNEIGFVWNVAETNNTWGILYQRLLTYKQRNGTTRVPYKYKIDPQLGVWVRNQRTICKIKDRIDLLNEIGFEWKIVQNDNWEVMYQRLVAFKKEHGTTCVPKSVSHKEHFQLSTWVSTQRQFCKKTDRIELLNDIGFVWNALKSWKVMYHRLLTYKQKHGTTCVPYDYQADPQLGVWVQNQRTICKNKDQIDLLNNIGFVWKKDKTNDWGLMYERLWTYKKAYGTTHVPESYKADPQLGSWVNDQRNSCRKQDRIDLLNHLGFVWRINK